jgi:hypothetical protein
LNPKTLLSSVGHITVGRRYFACGGCGAKHVPFDQWAGMGGRSLTHHARRMVTLAGTSWPFDRASGHLLELCHVSVSDDTIERVCQEEGERARRWAQEAEEPARAFAAAAGRAEFSSDGVKVNTVGGWREMRLSVLARREPAAPCEPAQWDRRVLNEPTARLAWCAIADATRVGSSWQRMAKRVGLGDGDRLSVLGDGARWIWDQAARRFGRCGAEWCVDIYHVGQHLHDCAKALLGEGPAARAWADGQRSHLLEHDGVGLMRRLAEQQKGARRPAHRAALDRLLGYLGDNRDSLWYRQRLRDGLPIGTGLIEGACKNTIGARLKANSARWRIRRVERIGALRCLDYSGHWDTYWRSRAA